ncbi:hypothetical protein Acr_13g0002990 [Actinidia rufa]|uniref:Uncharacterized protein n=1 Tax=Actinidia rufa TaxID=165716 RepID=A0A7J0FJM4_9ERIC|nr:hypothetical protein Acr_13g0002990 [Actinidia rufa]
MGLTTTHRLQQIVYFSICINYFRKREEGGSLVDIWQEVAEAVAVVGECDDGGTRDGGDELGLVTKGGESIIESPPIEFQIFQSDPQKLYHSLKWLHLVEEEEEAQENLEEPSSRSFPKTTKKLLLWILVITHPSQALTGFSKISDIDDDDDHITIGVDVPASGCSTPKGHRFQIPEILTCPPAPKKRRALPNCSIRRTPIAFFAPPEIEQFFLLALRHIPA